MVCRRIDTERAFMVADLLDWDEVYRSRFGAPHPEQVGLLVIGASSTWLSVLHRAARLEENGSLPKAPGLALNPKQPAVVVYG